MLRSQRSRGRRRQQRSAGSSCPGPCESAEEGKQGDSDHETTSSSGGSCFFDSIESCLIIYSFEISVLSATLGQVNVKIDNDCLLLFLIQYHHFFYVFLCQSLSESIYLP